MSNENNSITEVAATLGRTLYAHEVPTDIGIPALAFLMCVTGVDIGLSKEQMLGALGDTYDLVAKELASKRKEH